jgi:hypothetical protein
LLFNQKHFNTLIDHHWHQSNVSVSTQKQHAITQEHTGWGQEYWPQGAIRHQQQRILQSFRSSGQSCHNEPLDKKTSAWSKLPAAALWQMQIYLNTGPARKNCIRFNRCLMHIHGAYAVSKDAFQGDDN